PKKESELEPYTDYNCTGQIKDNNNNTIKTTTAVHIRIDCDFKINTTESSVTSTVIKFSWNTTSVKCPSVLHELEKLSYICRCPNHYENLLRHPIGIVFLIIIISSIITLEVVFVAVYMVYIKKCRKSRNDMTEDMMTTTAIYVNAPTPGGCHKKDS
ncbi:hypothetical protein INR49_025319, partial [Caranx melampygus]